MPHPQAARLSEMQEKLLQFGNQSMTSRWSRWGLMLSIVLTLVAGAIVAIPMVREPVLRSAGWALVVNEPSGVADIIVVSTDSGGAGALEAADLAKSGI